MFVICSRISISRNPHDGIIVQGNNSTQACTSKPSIQKLNMSRLRPEHGPMPCHLDSTTIQITHAQSSCDHVTQICAPPKMIQCTSFNFTESAYTCNHEPCHSTYTVEQHSSRGDYNNTELQSLIPDPGCWLPPVSLSNIYRLFLSITFGNLERTTIK
jgi:hypothetical protein